LRGHDGPVYTVGFAPGGDRIVTAGADGIVRIWNPSGALLALRAGHNDSIYSAVFRRDGARIATASWDGTARVWVTEPDSLVRSATSDKKLSSVDVARDGHIVTASEDGSATVWNADLSPARSLPARGVHAAFSPDGTRIVTAEANHVARVWRVSDGAVVQSLVGHQQEVFCARFSASGDRIATASRDGTARLWDATGQTAKLDHGRSQVTWAAFGPAGEVVTTSHDDAGIRVWSTSGGHTPALQSLDVTFRIEYSRDGRHAVALHGRGSDNATVWEVSTGKPLGTLSHTDRIVGARFSPDGAFVATASRDHAVRIWDARRFKLLRVLMGHTDDATDVAFENDTDLLTVGYDGSLRRWRIEQDRRSLRELDDLVRCRVGWGLDANGVLTRRSPDVCD
jgi:WD40 repeat protein